jgi:hypothetical protein
VLVSHWPVTSEAAIKLTTRTFAELEKNPDLGRAEAMRAAMLATIAEGGRAAHPAPTGRRSWWWVKGPASALACMRAKANMSLD